jgi:hypothetical protein
MIKKFLCMVLIATILVPMFISAVVVQAEPATVIEIQPASIIDSSLDVNSTFVINVNVFDVVDLYTWQIKLFFNTSLVRCINAWYPSDHVFAGKPFCPVNPLIDNNAGFVLYGCTLLGNVTPFTGNGPLCQILFMVVGRGACGLNFSKPYGLSETFLLDYYLNTIPAIVKDGYFDNRFTFARNTFIKVVDPETGNNNFLFGENIPIGSKFLANVTVSNVLELAAWQVNLTWNPKILTIATPDDVFVPSDHIFENFDHYFPNKVIENSTGHLLWGCALAAGSFNGSGTMFQVRFTVIKTPEEGKTLSCSIHIDRESDFSTTLLKIEGEELKEIPFETLDGFYQCTGFSIKFSPEKVITNPGAKLNYEISLQNFALSLNVLLLNVTGIDDSWYSLQNVVVLSAEETRIIPLEVNVPLDAISGNYTLTLMVYSLTLDLFKTKTSELKLVENPILLNLVPINGSRIGTSDVSILWETPINCSSEVFVREQSETEFTRHLGAYALFHAIVIENLTRNRWYCFFVRSNSSRGSSISELRWFYVTNGVVFTQRFYNFNIQRDYDQHLRVGVVNENSKPHQLLLTASSTSSDLVFGFVGEGSQDKIVTIVPGQLMYVDLVVHAQDARVKDYVLTLNLTSFAENDTIIDFAYCYVHVQFPYINVTLVEEAVDQWTLTKTFRVRNYGETLTDFSIECDGGLVGNVVFRPVVQHYYFASGAAFTFNVVPILSENFKSIAGHIVAKAAGSTCASILANFTLPPGKNVYLAYAPNLSIEFSKYYDNDESPNTNPTAEKPVESYIINNTLIFFSQIIVDVYQNGKPVSGLNVSLTIWNETVSYTEFSCTLFAGKAKFEVMGTKGTYHYQAKLVDYGCYTEIRTFSVSTIPLFQIRPRSISWTEISDGNSTFTHIIENSTIELDKGPFTFKARQEGIEQNATFNLCLTWELDKYKKIYVPGLIQGDTLVFQTETIPSGNYSACVLSYSPSNGLTTSFPIRIHCLSWLPMYQNGNYTYNLPFPLNSTHIIKLTIDHSVSSRDSRLAFDVVNVVLNGSEYLFTFAAITNTTTDQQFKLKVITSQMTLQDKTLILPLEAYIPATLNVTVPLWNGSNLYDFNVNLQAGFSTVYLQIHPNVEYAFDAFIWVGGNSGILKILHLDNNPMATVIRCGVGLLLPPRASLALDIVDLAAEVLASSSFSEMVDEVKSLGIWYLVHGNALKGLRKAFVAKVGEYFGRNAAKYIGKAIPIVENLITLYECYQDWDRIWRLDHGEGFLDTILGLIYHCTNRPIVSFDFDLYFPIIDSPQVHGEVDVYLAPRFLLPWPFSSYCPHDIDIWLNNWLATSFTMTVPNGHYGLQIDPEYLIFPSGGTARNRVTIATRHLNGGNYVVATGMLLSILYRRIRTYLVASSLEEATSKVNELMSSKFANKIDPAVFPEDIKIAPTIIEGVQKLNVTVWNLGATLAFQVPIQVFDGENLIGEVLVTLPPFQSATFTLNWNATVGAHQLRVIVDPFNTRDEMDEKNNQASKSITVYETDRTPPTTALHVFGPYRVRDGYIQITPEAGFWLTAQDNIGGSGVATTTYRIRNATFNTGWITYQNPFYIPSPVEGTYYIDYYSIDNAGKVETIKTMTIVVTFVLWRIDVAIVSVTTSTNETYVGRLITITLTVANYGELPQTFNVTTYYNSTVIKSVIVNNLTPNTSTIIIITWNTSKVEPHHNYTISASIPTIPYESDTSNNLLIDGMIKIKKFADVNGDGKIDLKDISLVAKAFGTREGNLKWDTRCDINGDGKVDIRDLLLVARRLWH